MSDPQAKQPCSFNHVYSMKPSIKLSEYLCEIATGENRVGSKRRGMEVGREKERKRAADYWSERQSIGQK
jgi:hypothetical protein